MADHLTRLKGTPEQLATQLSQLAHGKIYRIVEVEETATSKKPRRRVSAMGKYAGVLNSEAFMQRKHEEAEREDQPLR
jgi:hypothetical protein